jgi:hypothetical protein
MIVNGLNLDRLVELEGQVVEPVPLDQRSEYIYWRAGHLGNIALNFIKGHGYLNAWGADYTHFWPNYSWAVNTAKELAKPNPTRKNQFGEEHRYEFAKLTGLEHTFVYPAIVLALDKSFNDGSQLEKLRAVDPFTDSLEELFDPVAFAQPYSFGGGYILRGPLTLDALDPHSKEAIQTIFALE